ncbi:MAG: hypothetical protein IAE79_15635 [Anaerolinea sp.]|nr:hypothetical protein [Anaerolinea sp.]
MFQFPNDPRKIQERIKQYESDLRKEYKKFRYISDDSGKRYLIGPMYLLIGDITGATKSFAWFEKEFSDDGGEPFHLLCWALSLYQSNDKVKATKKLCQAMLSNLYLLPFLLNIEQPDLDIQHSSNWEEKDYIEHGPSELLQIWDEQALQWARELYQSDSFREARERSIEILRLLKSEPVGPKRSQLVKELFALQYSN